MKLRKEWKACIAALLIAAIPVSFGGQFNTDVEAADNISPAVSTNIHHEDYYEGNGKWASNVKSYLYRSDTDGSLTRVEVADGTASVLVEVYDGTTFTLKSKTTLAMELPLFGGCYMGRDYNYIVYGRENTGTAAQDVFRVVQYSKDWTTQVRSSALSSAVTNTRTPFSEGSLRFCESGSMLYIRTCHSVNALDGSLSQTNLTFSYNTRTGDIVTGNVGYTGSSYNQFVRVDGDMLVAADHTSESIMLSRYRVGGSNEMVNILSDGSVSGGNANAAVGGLEVSGSSYLVAYQAGLGNNATGGVRNIYVGKISRADFTSTSVTNTQITSYLSTGNSSASNPVLAKISDSSFVLLWEEYNLTQANKGGNTLHYVMLNGEGVPQGAVYTVSGSLSDCQPVVSGNRLIWYVTDNSQPQFYTLDLSVNTFIGATPGPSAVPTAGISASPSVSPSVSPTASPTIKPVITPRPPRSPMPIATPRPTATPYPPYDEVVEDDSDLFNDDEVGPDNPSLEEINASATEEQEKNSGSEDDDGDSDSVPAKGTHISSSNAEYVVINADDGWGTAKYYSPRTNASSIVVPANVVIDGITYEVHSIAAGAFKNNKTITGVTIGKNVIQIGNNAFNGCTNLKTISLGSSVKTIKKKAFYNCKKLSKIILPASTAKIGQQAFAGCNKLKQITVKSTKLTKAKVGGKAFTGVPQNAVVKVPKAKLATYRKIFRKKGLNSNIKIKKL